MEAAGEDDLTSTDTFVTLEHPCFREEGEDSEAVLRLDILIHTKDAIIGIEHKINAPLYNDIATYKKELEALEKKHSKPHHAFVLSLRNINEIQKLRNSFFVPVQYLDFIKKVRKNMKAINLDNNSKYAFMLNDFLDTLENYKNSVMNIDDKYTFYQSRHEDIQAFLNEFNRFKQEVKDSQTLLYNRLMALANEVNGPESTLWGLYNPEEYDCNSICFQRQLKERAIGLELTIKATEKSATGLIELHLVYWGKEIEVKHRKLWDLFLSGIKHFQSGNSLKDCSDGNKGLIHLFTFEEENLSDSEFKTIIKYYEDEFNKVLYANWDFDNDALKENLHA